MTSKDSLKDVVIGIIGGGVVGHATAKSWVEYVKEVKIYDSDPVRSTHSLADTLFADFTFICLPTPQKPNSLECDISTIGSVLRQIIEIDGGDGIYVLRSTVPVGTCRKLSENYNLKHLLHCPEFLTARCSVIDAHTPSRHVIGGGAERQGVHFLMCLLQKRFPGVPVLHCTYEESELIKLATNAFFATKIAFLNEINAFAQFVKADWNTVLTGILLDGRISHSHTKVPGPDNKFGFGGACLPKDLANLIHCMDSMKYSSDLSGIEAHVCRAVYRRNLDDRERYI